ncbi:hypothetical protein DXG01_016855 [Tephrocybe rancida]|nr:hypothetical protein DXG01_016855 [Tephrocybe rancida]
MQSYIELRHADVDTASLDELASWLSVQCQPATHAPAVAPLPTSTTRSAMTCALPAAAPQPPSQRGPAIAWPSGVCDWRPYGSPFETWNIDNTPTPCAAFFPQKQEFLPSLRCFLESTPSRLQIGVKEEAVCWLLVVCLLQDVDPEVYTPAPHVYATPKLARCINFTMTHGWAREGSRPLHSRLEMEAPHTERLARLARRAHRRLIRDTLIQARELRTLELRSIVHFPLAAALPLGNLIIRLGSGPFDTTTASHSPTHHLQSLHMERHAILRTLIDVPFLSISRLVRFEAFEKNNVDTIITIQHVLDVCAETLQVFHLNVYRDEPFTHPLTLTLLKSLTTLHLPGHFSCPDAFPWCTHTLSALPLPVSSPTIAVTLQAAGSLPSTDTDDTDWPQIDRLLVRTLHIHRETKPQYDIHELEELLPGLTGRNAIVGPPPPPPMEVRKPTTTRSSVWKRARDVLS